MEKNYLRKTKIVCTLGPSTDSEETLTALINAGMNVGRFNFSHGEHKEQEDRLALLKKVREQMQAPIAAMLDTKGPEIRLCLFKEGKVVLEEGQEFTLTTREIMGDQHQVQISYDNLPNDVSKGTHILIDDGLIDMVVESVDETDIHCTVLNGGKISDRKGVNVPNADLSMPYISPKDRKDIIFGVEHDFDFIAASFVRTAEDVQAIRSLLHEYGGDQIQIISKIENNQGIQNIDAIIRASDGIMVARGDMGVEIPLEEVPTLQKMIIKKTYQAGKIVITATQMLDSMISHPRPTRAEATDVANAIYDGTSAIMLSGETAMGAYPVEAVTVMDRIARRTEQDINYRCRIQKQQLTDDRTLDITTAISYATCTVAMDLNAAAIITVTMSGFTANMIARYKPGCQIIGCTVDKKVCRQLNLLWGVNPVLIKKENTTDSLFEEAVFKSKQAGLIKPGDTVVITAGVPLGIAGKTDMIHVVEVV